MVEEQTFHKWKVDEEVVKRAPLPESRQSAAVVAVISKAVGESSGNIQ